MLFQGYFQVQDDSSCMITFGYASKSALLHRSRPNIPTPTYLPPHRPAKTSPLQHTKFQKNIPYLSCCSSWGSMFRFASYIDISHYKNSSWQPVGWRNGSAWPSYLPQISQGQGCGFESRADRISLAISGVH